MRAWQFKASNYGLGTGRKRSDRRGATLVLIAILMVALLGMVAFAIDLGYIATVKTELQRSVDAGALAGAGLLVEGEAIATAEVMNFIQMNKVGGSDFNFSGEGGEPALDSGTSDEIEIETGHWDPDTKEFTVSDVLPSTIRVAVTRANQPLFFGRIFGKEAFNVSAETVAMYQPRDIMLVLDCSGSMNDDSELKSISSLSRELVELNLYAIYNQLGSPTYGNLQWTPQYINSTDDDYVLEQLGLDDVPYPYPSGSWKNYVDYVQTSSNIKNAGYKKDYGYLTWMNYLLEKKPRFDQTPDLWQTPEQPIQQVKDAVSLFIEYIQEVDSDDQLGLSIYTASDGTATLESGLTIDYDLIDTISTQRQAGHYDVYTNIGAGIKNAREELLANGRPNAFKMMVLMTDGIANRPGNSSQAKQYAQDQAALTAQENIPIITISLGSGADTNLMQAIADATEGVHFNVPGGSGIEQYASQLTDTFRSIADDRPLKLVK